MNEDPLRPAARTVSACPPLEEKHDAFMFLWGCIGLIFLPEVLAPLEICPRGTSEMLDAWENWGKGRPVHVCFPACVFSCV